MELYNFFSETVKPNRLDDLIEIMEELRCNCNFIEITRFHPTNGSSEYTLIGQIHGDDTNLGDTDLLTWFGSAKIKYTWFDARCHSINNTEILHED